MKNSLLVLSCVALLSGCSVKVQSEKEQPKPVFDETNSLEVTSSSYLREESFLRKIQNKFSFESVEKIVIPSYCCKYVVKDSRGDVHVLTYDYSEYSLDRFEVRKIFSNTENVQKMKSNAIYELIDGSKKLEKEDK